MTALTQWVAQNIHDEDELSGIFVINAGGRSWEVTDLLDLWAPEWREFTQDRLGAVPNPTFDPDLPCPHNDFEMGVNFRRIVDGEMTPVSYLAEIQVACTVCDESWRWSGLKPGLAHHEPMMSVDGLTLFAPFRPASADEDFGMGLPGFHVNLVGPELGHERTAAAVRKRALQDAADLVRGRIEPLMSVAAQRELRHAATALVHLADKEGS